MLHDLKYNWDLSSRTKRDYIFAFSSWQIAFVNGGAFYLCQDLT